MQQFLWQTILGDVPFFDTNCKLWPQARVLDLWHRMVSARYRDAVWVNHGMEIHNWLVVSNMAILCSISYIWDVIPNPLTFTSSFFKMVIAPPTRQSSPGDGEDPIGFVATLVVSGSTVLWANFAFEMILPLHWFHPHFGGSNLRFSLNSTAILKIPQFFGKRNLFMS